MAEAGLRGARNSVADAYLPAAAAAVTGILVGSGIVATRFVIDQTEPASLALLRYLIGFCCLLPFVLLSRRGRIARRDLLPIGLLGITQFGVLIWLMNFGLQSIPAARAALIFATAPLMTMMLGAAFGVEPLTGAKGLGVVLTIVGVGFALGEKVGERGSAGDAWVGELAVFLSALSGAVCSILYRPYLRKYPTLPIGAFAMLASVGFLAVLAAGEGFFGALPQFTAGGWLAVGFIGISSGVGYVFLLWALARETPTKVTAFLALSPLTAVGLGAVLLGEDASVLVGLGVVCVVVGLWVSQRRFMRGHTV